VSVEYLSLPGWKKKISNCRRYSDLPSQARDYVERVEQLVGVKGEYEVTEESWGPKVNLVGTPAED